MPFTISLSTGEWAKWSLIDPQQHQEKCREGIKGGDLHRGFWYWSRFCGTQLMQLFMSGGSIAIKYLSRVNWKGSHPMDACTTRIWPDNKRRRVGGLYQRPVICFVVAPFMRRDSVRVGCGTLKIKSRFHGEIKLNDNRAD